MSRAQTAGGNRRTQPRRKNDTGSAIECRAASAIEIGVERAGRGPPVPIRVIPREDRSDEEDRHGARRRHARRAVLAELGRGALLVERLPLALHPLSALLVRTLLSVPLL